MNFDKGKILSAFVWSAVCILLFFVFVGGIVRGVDTQDYPIHIKIASGISMEGTPAVISISARSMNNAGKLSIS